MSDSEEKSLLVQISDGNDTNDDNSTNKITVRTKKLYKKSYDNFIEWRKKENISTTSENVLLRYFQEINKKYSPSTLNTEFSMLKTTIITHEKIDISEYSNLKAFLKQISQGYEAKKSKIFTLSEIKSFIENAPDEGYLLLKVAVIFGIMGACRRQELHNLKCQDVIDTQNTLKVRIMRGKKIDRIFIISGEYYDICKKYMSLRPESDNLRFFIRYANGKCVNQNIGINKFGGMGKLVATVLKLPNPELYTSHCFRRSSLNLCDNDDNLLNKRGWQSATAEQCDELNSRITISSEIKDNNCLASETLRMIVPDAPGPSKIIYGPNVSTNKPVKPLRNGSQRCRFCSQYSEEYIPISPKYLAAGKTTLVFNNVQVHLDFTDNYTNVVCKDCDIKLQIMYDFVKDVKATQESLFNVELEMEAREDIGIEMVMFKTEYEENDSPDEDDAVEINYENPDEDDNDSDNDNDTKAGMLDSLIVSETRFITENVSQKRKTKISAEKTKKAKIANNEYTDFITDVKVEVIERDGTNDANDTGFSDTETTGVDVKPCVEELANSTLIHKMRNDGNSLSDFYTTTKR